MKRFVKKTDVLMQSTEGCGHVSTQQIYTRCKTSMTAVKSAGCNHRSLLQARSRDNNPRMDSNIARCCNFADCTTNKSQDRTRLHTSNLLDRDTLLIPPEVPPMPQESPAIEQGRGLVWYKRDLENCIHCRTCACYGVFVVLESILDPRRTKIHGKICLVVLPR